MQYTPKDNTRTIRMPLPTLSAKLSSGSVKEKKNCFSTWVSEKMTNFFGIQWQDDDVNDDVKMSFSHKWDQHSCLWSLWAVATVQNDERCSWHRVGQDIISWLQILPLLGNIQLLVFYSWCQHTSLNPQTNIVRNEKFYFMFHQRFWLFSATAYCTDYNSRTRLPANGYHQKLQKWGSGYRPQRVFHPSIPKQRMLLNRLFFVEPLWLEVCS